jgi:hypothetical protein
MSNQESLHRAVLEAVEAKIEALSRHKELVEGEIFEFYLKADFASTHPSFAVNAVIENIGRALVDVEQKKFGKIKLVSIQHESTHPERLDSMLIEDYDAQRDHYWKLKYSKKSDLALEKESGSFYMFYLTRKGLLYRVRPEHSIEELDLDEDSVAHKVMQSFIGSARDEYIPTTTLADEAGTSVGTIRVEINGLKGKIEFKFEGINRDEFLEGKRNKRYRLGERINLREK